MRFQNSTAIALCSVAALAILAGCGSSTKQAGTNPTNPTNPKGPTNPTNPTNPKGPTDPTDPNRRPSISFGLDRGDLTSAVFATDATDIHQAIAAGSFRSYHATLARDSAALTVTLTDKHHIESVAGDGDFGFRVTYQDKEAGTAQKVIHFPASGLYPGGSYRAQYDLDYWLWPYPEFGRFPLDGTHYGTEPGNYAQVMGMQFPDQSRSYMVFGLETPAANLPAGSATFKGDFRGDVFDSDFYNSVSLQKARDRIRGDVTLNVNFAASTLQGGIDNIRFRDAGEPNYYSDPDMRIGMSGGKVHDTEFSAKLSWYSEGKDIGIKGGLLGTFYGPNAEQAGAVVNMSHPSGKLALIGAIRTGRQ